jgi:hypothetical protein
LPDELQHHHLQLPDSADATLGHRPARSEAALYGEAVGLQVEASRRRNYMILVVVDDIIGVVLWRIMFGSFVGLFEGRGNYGFLTFSTVIVAFAMRASIITSWEPAESDVEEREEKREKKVGALLVAG